MSGTTKSGTNSKTTTQDEAKRKDLEEQIRTRVSSEERAFRIVMKLVEDTVTLDRLKDMAHYMMPSHYQDICEERAITKVCGYPVCDNPLPRTQGQRYHISTKTNKVYDITERKSFCSNHCFKHSKLFENQILTTPLWLRSKEQPVNFKVPDRKNDKGWVGKEVIYKTNFWDEEEEEEEEEEEKEKGPSKNNNSNKGGQASCSNNNNNRGAPSLLDSRDWLNELHHSLYGGGGGVADGGGGGGDGAGSVGKLSSVTAITTTTRDSDVNDDDGDEEEDEDMDCYYGGGGGEGEGEEVYAESSEEGGGGGRHGRILREIPGDFSQLERFCSDLIDSDDEDDDHDHDDGGGSYGGGRCDSSGSSSSGVGSGGRRAVEVRSTKSSRKMPRRTKDRRKLCKSLPTGSTSNNNTTTTSTTTNNTNTTTTTTKRSTKPCEAPVDPRLTQLRNLLDKRKHQLLHYVEPVVLGSGQEGGLVLVAEASGAGTYGDGGVVGDKGGSGVGSGVVEDRGSDGDGHSSVQHLHPVSQVLAQHHSEGEVGRAAGNVNVQQQETESKIPPQPQQQSQLQQSQVPQSQQLPPQLQQSLLPPPLSPSDKIINFVQSWITLESLKFLGLVTPKPTEHSGKGSSSSGNSSTAAAVTADDVAADGVNRSGLAEDSDEIPNSQKVSSEFSRLCDRVAIQGEEFESLLDDDHIPQADILPKKDLPSYQTLQKQTENFSFKVKEYFKPIPKRKTSDNEESDSKLVLPPVDSYSQLSLRRSIFLEQLSRRVDDLICPMDLSIEELSTEVKDFVHTFCLLNTNIVLKTQEWDVAAMFIIIMLSKRSVRLAGGLDQSKVQEKFNTVLHRFQLSLNQVNSLVSQILSREVE
ncbi:hypothetical protein Ahia01_000981200 [Argonauta hians]